MRVIDLRKSIEKRLAQILETQSSIRAAHPLIADLLSQIIDEVPISSEISVRVIDINEIRYSVFYQCGPNISETAIVVSQASSTFYLWRDEGWVLDDDYYEPEELSKVICTLPILCAEPKNVKQLVEAIESGVWAFKPEYFPKFGGVPPEDLEEVLSWDSEKVLVGTKHSNMEILSRESWQELSSRENGWFKKTE
ncbi:hypothetical protein [Microbulbifer sp. JTAC008]|uniref:hypothetical protein n=1 Tax=unclassified Microbulbifer TaxID=2619833 RepID=UPI00403995AA